MNGARDFLRRTAWGLVPLLAAVAGCAAPGSAAPPPTSSEPAPAGGGLSLFGPTRDERDLLARAKAQLLLAAESDVPEVRCNAIEALVKVAPREGVPRFRAALRDDSPLVRYAGYAALGEVRDSESLAALASGVSDESPFVRLAAAYAGARLGKSGYVRLLVDTLKGRAPDNQRADAAALLGRLGDPRAVPWLKAALKTGPNERSKSVTLSIHAALARLGQRDSVQELVRYTQGDAATRTEALLLLADLRDREAYAALRYRFLAPGEEYVEARLIAARGLGAIGDPEGYDLAMRNLTFTDSNTRPTPENPSRTFTVRSLAAHALAEIRDKRALPGLARIAASPDDPRLQVAASYAICRIIGS
ncbi:MAG: HEAT repeat domain-containing protein [Phycisphaerales bacterium]|nr:HEAT repeat domain-containing protein [Phycisphaerales bacterium]